MRSQYRSDESDLSGSMDLMRESMKCFGVELEDTSEGLYCNVLDV